MNGTASLRTMQLPYAASLSIVRLHCAATFILESGSVIYIQLKVSIVENRVPHLPPLRSLQKMAKKGSGNGGCCGRG